MLRWLSSLLILVYRAIGSPQLGGSCRYEPSCSAYALEAFAKLRLDRAFILTLYRLWRCRPGGGMGYDPVPNNSEQLVKQHKRCAHLQKG